MSEKKAIEFLNENKDIASKFCTDNFPVKEKIITEFKIDSSGYMDSYDRLMLFTDSILDQLERKPANKIIYVDSIRTVIKRQIKEVLKPCIDSNVVTTITIEDIAKEKYLQSVIDKNIIQIEELNNKVYHKNKLLWIFIFIAIAEFLFITRKLWLKLI